jgi:RNA polymerase sigma-70 factor (ECF subfamily)
MLSGPEAALAEVAVVEQDGRLARYHYLYAVKAELLRQMGREDEAEELDRKAMEMTENQAEQNLLADRVARPR